MANIAEKFKHFIRNRFYADYAIKHGQVPTETSINKYTERLKHEVDDHYNLWRIQGECLAIEWNQEIEYEYGETCSFLGKNYICILKNINVKPGTNAKYWKPISPEEYTNFYVQRFLPKDNDVPYEPGEIWKEERSIDYHPVTVKFLEERLDWWFKNVTVTNADMLDGFHADFFVSLEVFNNYLETVLLKTDVIDSLTSDEKKKPLSANMGRVLNNEIQLIKGILKSDDLDLDELQEVVDFIKKNKKRLDNLGIDDVDGLRKYLDMLTNNINHLVDIELNNYYDKEQIDNLLRPFEECCKKKITQGIEIVAAHNLDVNKLKDGFIDPTQFLKGSDAKIQSNWEQFFSVKNNVIDFPINLDYTFEIGLLPNNFDINAEFFNYETFNYQTLEPKNVSKNPDNDCYYFHLVKDLGQESVSLDFVRHFSKDSHLFGHPLILDVFLNYDKSNRKFIKTLIAKTDENFSRFHIPHETGGDWKSFFGIEKRGKNYKLTIGMNAADPADRTSVDFSLDSLDVAEDQLTQKEKDIISLFKEDGFVKFGCGVISYAGSFTFTKIKQYLTEIYDYQSKILWTRNDIYGQWINSGKPDLEKGIYYNPYLQKLFMVEEDPLMATQVALNYTGGGSYLSSVSYSSSGNANFRALRCNPSANTIQWQTGGLGISKVNNSTFRVTHNLGHTNYAVTASINRIGRPLGASSANVVAIENDYCDISCHWGGDNTAGDVLPTMANVTIFF